MPQFEVVYYVMQKHGHWMHDRLKNYFRMRWIFGADL